MISYPAQLQIEPLTQPPIATIAVPGSKSITNRALVLAAFYGSQSGCTLHGALQSEDTDVMVSALRSLGFRINADWPACKLQIHREENTDLIPAQEADLFVANSGTTMRFLTALVSLGHGRYRLDGVPRMRERPIEDLLSALRQLGVRAVSENNNGCPPVIVDSTGLSGGQARIKGDVSSQFLSGLLMVAPCARSDIIIEVDGPLVSWPYVSMTVDMMRHWGFAIEATRSRFDIPGRQQAEVENYVIEPDASAASYFFASAAITGGQVTVPHLSKNSLQGDVRFADALEKMGCAVTWYDNAITVRGGPLHGIDIDMNDISDTVMTLAAVACFAQGPTSIRKVAHIRHKETDRLAALSNELRRLGASIDELADGLTITPGPLHGATVQTYNDHRMAMSLALVGLRVPGISIDHPACVAKTYPLFFDDLQKLR